MSSVDIKYDAPQTVGRFMDSGAFFRIIAGPVGSGKTTGCIFELLRRAIEQAPCKDGLRHTRFAIVRQTLKQLKDTVLKDIEQWLQGLVHYKVSENTIYINFGDVRSEWLLIPLEDAEDQRRLLSMQLTGAWLSEAIEMDVGIISPILGRCGRYPGMGMKPENVSSADWPTWFGAIADTNMPTEGDPWHVYMTEPPPQSQIFIQPGGREPAAENIENLPGGVRYYENLATGRSPEWVTRYVDAQFGPDPSGSAVFRASFKRAFHSVKLTPEQIAEGVKYALEPSSSYPLVITQDFGRNPCSLICQMDHKGRALVLEEIVSEDMGLELHITTKLLPTLQKERWMGKKFYIIGDPAGNSKNTTFEETSFDTLKSHGLAAFPAPTNDIKKRIAAVDKLLNEQRDGGAALLIDADQCPRLMQAISGKYRYARRKSGQLAPLPEKLHPWSDLADDLQYFCLAVQGGFNQYMANRLERSRSYATERRPPMPARAWT